MRSGSPISPNSRVSPNRSDRLPLAPQDGPPSSLRAWWLAIRVPTLPASVVPVLVGSAAALGRGHFHGGAFAAALLGAVLIQVGTNLANDLLDFRKGADTAERLGPVRVTQAGLLSPAQVAAGVWASFVPALLCTLYLVTVGGWPLLAVGIASIAAGIAYTGGPWPLAYHGLGDLFAFAFFGVIAVGTTYYLHAGAIDWYALIVSLPIAFLVTAILVVNNLRDLETDEKAGKRTLAVRIGPRATRAEYALCLTLPYVVPLLLWGTGEAGTLFWLPYLSLPLALGQLRPVLKGAAGRLLNGVLKGTGRLELAYGLLFALSLVS